jgi:hypothetical protein
MNAKTFVTAIAAVCASFDANAGEPSLSTVAVRADAPVVVDCHEEHLPNFKAIGVLLDNNNASYINMQRERIVHIAHRECLRGAGYVAFVRDDSATPASLALADTRP